MSSDKFDETDRRAVVSALEKQLNVRLKRVGNRRKWFRDEAGRNYWVLGGYGEWHGIPEEMMQDEVGASTSGLLVIATRQRAAIEIFIGSLSPLVQGRASLYRARETTNDYQFTLKKRGNRLAIDQIPAAGLDDLVGFSFTEPDKEGVARAEELTRLFNELPAEEKKRLLESLAQQTIPADRAKPRSG